MLQSFKLISRIIFTFILILGVHSPALTAQPIKVMASILPQKYFLEQIGKNILQVEIMVQPGANPATYEPRPSQMALLSSAKAYFAIGVPFETRWLPRFSKANPEMKIIKTQLGIEKLPMQSKHRHKKNHGIKDPHIWLAPSLAKIIAINIRNGLIQIAPEHRSKFIFNYYELAEQISHLDLNLLKLFKNNQEKRRFLVYHPAWGYFAREYGLKQIPVQIEGKSPSPGQFKKIIQLGQKLNLKHIFVQPQFSKQNAQMLSKSLNAKIVSLDPLSENWLTNLKTAAEKIQSGLR